MSSDVCRHKIFDNPASQIAEHRQEFDAYDEDRSGYIDVKEGISPVVQPAQPRNQEPNLSKWFLSVILGIHITFTWQFRGEQWGK